MFRTSARFSSSLLPQSILHTVAITLFLSGRKVLNSMCQQPMNLIKVKQLKLKRPLQNLVCVRDKRKGEISGIGASEQ